MSIGGRYRGGHFRIASCAALALALGGGAVGSSPVSAAASRPAQPPVALVCHVAGPAKGRGELTDEAICARFTTMIQEALGQPIKRTARLPAGERGRWIRLEVRLLPRGRAEAAFTSKLHGKATNHPLLAVQVMDKTMDLREIDKLARLAGKTLAGQ
jgi:hypothetical protein